MYDRKLFIIQKWCYCEYIDMKTTGKNEDQCITIKIKHPSITDLNAQKKKKRLTLEIYYVYRKGQFTAPIDTVE